VVLDPLHATIRSVTGTGFPVKGYEGRWNLGTSLEGTRVGPYLVESPIGTGGMGQVCRAVVTRTVRDLTPGQRVAVKVIHPHLATSATLVQRFLREAEIGSKVRSPHLVATLDAGLATIDGAEIPYLAMDLVEGESLLVTLRKIGCFPDELCRRVGRDVAEALAALHRGGIVHRDVKLENVLSTTDERTLVSDFGTARLLDEHVRLTQSGQFVGTMLYAAPEQFRGNGHGITGAADLYSLGWLLYYLAAGRHPFEGRTYEAVAHGQLHETPAPLQESGRRVTPFLSAVVAALLEKDPKARFPSAADLARTLREGEESPWWKETGCNRAQARPVPAAVSASPAAGVAPPSAGVLEELAPQDRDLLSIAACIGETFDPGLAGAAYGLGPIESLRRFASFEGRYGVVRGTQGEYRFAAPILRDIVLREIPTALRSDFLSSIDRARTQVSMPDRTDTLAAPPDAAAARGDSTTDPDVRPKSRILVVDDDPTILCLLRKEVGLLGHEVVGCDNGLAALVRMRRDSFDLLVTDIQMPGLDGLDLLRRLKADTRLKDVPVIVVSGSTQGDLPVLCIREGAEDYLPKPHDFVLLQARVGACLERRRLHQQQEAYRSDLERYSFQLEEVLRQARSREGSVERAVQELEKLEHGMPASYDASRKALAETLQKLRAELRAGAP
jgi:DNA-binding response OmpR family regulator